MIIALTTSCRFTKPILSREVPPESIYDTISPKHKVYTYKGLSIFKNRTCTYTVFPLTIDSSNVIVWHRKEIKFKRRDDKMFETIYTFVNDTIENKIKRAYYTNSQKHGGHDFIYIDIYYKNGKKEGIINDNRNLSRKQRKKLADRFFHME